MKKKIMTLLALILPAITARASVNHGADLNAEDARERQIVRAIETLVRAQAIVVDPQTNRIEIRQDIVERLKAEGKLDEAYASNGSFCM